ncbi:MAG: hypothetical protein ED556_07135 [Winogradskyella sp.]|uniref:hypothetical protein n=1 Tax=Winogradskyella sp. TaxID=1883156 RepID=UPI000F3B2CAE|nr:hypothetical protein [Winogradskyella sp.]RNC87187.1 MAG: hypothetical protein ED556_07135 [Winogradskyella sp.]
MKSRHLIAILSIFLFSSCIVKSIQPFYVSQALEYNVALKGEWTDNKKGAWEIISFKEVWEKDNDPNVSLSKEDKDAYNRYKEGYFVKYTKKETEASFIAMPFKVNDHIFLDFTPFEYDSDELNGLLGQHLLKTHSVAQVNFNNDEITLKWLSEKAIKSLIKNNRLRIKHEKIGIDQDLVLTASSQELYQFLEKFTVSDFEEKWDNDDIYKLRPADAKP